MGDPEEGEIRPLPIDPQIVSQQAQSTIKSLVDAVVELVTNSDDSYRRLGEKGPHVAGQIDVHVKRQRGGVCRLLEVSDAAEGMDWEGLEKAVTFAASSSGFFEGRTVRGLFGRGLKEAIVGLGRGSIWTAKDGKESEVDIFVDKVGPKYRVTKKARPTGEAEGTKVTIEVVSPRIRCPTFDYLYRQLSHHFALRDILQSAVRAVRLRLDDDNIRRMKPLTFRPLVGRLRSKEQLDIEGFGKAVLEIYEASEKLEFVSGDPGSLPGILIRTEGAILDSRLFGFEGDDAAHYFYGWLDCPGIAEVIRQGDFGVLNSNRSGLDLRHEYCRSLDAQVKRVLKPLVSAKRKELEGQGPSKLREEYKRKLSDLCRLLNALVKDELEDLPPWGQTGAEITTLVVRPEVGYAEPNQPRLFSVYAPERLVADFGLDAEVALELEEVKGNVRLIGDRVRLQPHQKHAGLLTGQFRVVGSSYGDHAFVTARIDGLEDQAQLKVQSPSHVRRQRLSGTSSGLFNNIDFDESPDPIQRVSFSDGVIKVLRRFPPIPRYLKPGGEGMDSPQGSLMLAELVAEAFCKEVARRRIESVDPPPTTGGGAEVDHFSSRVNQLMLKYLGAIHEALVA